MVVLKGRICRDLEPQTRGELEVVGYVQFILHIEGSLHIAEARIFL